MAQDPPIDCAREKSIGLQTTANKIDILLKMLSDELRLRWQRDDITIGWILGVGTGAAVRSVDLLGIIPKGYSDWFLHDPIEAVGGTSPGIPGMVEIILDIDKYGTPSPCSKVWWRTTFIGYRIKFLMTRKILQELMENFRKLKDSKDVPFVTPGIEQYFQDIVGGTGNTGGIFIDEYITSANICLDQITAEDTPCRVRASYDAIFDALDEAVDDGYFWKRDINTDETQDCKKLTYKEFKRKYLSPQLKKQRNDNLEEPGWFDSDGCSPYGYDDPTTMPGGVGPWGDIYKDIWNAFNKLCCNVDDPEVSTGISGNPI